MLLGGCFYYGFEYYEDVLEWFKCIVSMDVRCVFLVWLIVLVLWGDVNKQDSYVEVILNIVVILYCMNRQDEVEWEWFKVIKLRLSYLEVVEYLVGLLCLNYRSQEVVNIIEYIQKLLRMFGINGIVYEVNEMVSEVDMVLIVMM